MTHDHTRRRMPCNRSYGVAEALHDRRWRIAGAASGQTGRRATGIGSDQGTVARRHTAARRSRTSIARSSSCSSTTTTAPSAWCSTDRARRSSTSHSTVGGPADEPGAGLLRRSRRDRCTDRVARCANTPLDEDDERGPGTRRRPRRFCRSHGRPGVRRRARQRCCECFAATPAGVRASSRARSWPGRGSCSTPSPMTCSPRNPPALAHGVAAPGWPPRLARQRARRPERQLTRLPRAAPRSPVSDTFAYQPPFVS